MLIVLLPYKLHPKNSLFPSNYFYLELINL